MPRWSDKWDRPIRAERKAAQLLQTMECVAVNVGVVRSQHKASPPIRRPMASASSRQPASQKMGCSINCAEAVIPRRKGVRWCRLKRAQFVAVTVLFAYVFGLEHIVVPAEVSIKACRSATRHQAHQVAVAIQDVFVEKMESYGIFAAVDAVNNY